MSSSNNDQDRILGKLGITTLNAMQNKAIAAISTKDDVLLLSPTGSGKTVAFLLPLILRQKKESTGVKVLIIVPSRELAIQIESVARNMGSGLKINAVYGGRPISRDKQDLRHAPDILIGTPGRIGDHMRRQTIDVSTIETVVLDEYDKSLEIGFEEEMSEIFRGLPSISQKIFTSATAQVEIPGFVDSENLQKLDFLSSNIPDITLRLITSQSKDKLETLLQALKHMGNNRGIIFCNFRESVNRISSFLASNKVSHGIYHGGLEQKDRERALIKFRNETSKIIVATDLAARGLDIPEVAFILHYHLPNREEEFIHRNGRTARMHNEGSSFILQYQKEPLPEFIGNLEKVELSDKGELPQSSWSTILISGGRKDKISKSDIAGLLMKNGGLPFENVGLIELKKDCAFVAVDSSQSDKIVQQLNNTKLKRKKVRLSIV